MIEKVITLKIKEFYKNKIEIIEEKINREEDRLEQNDLTSLSDSMSYNYHLGKLSELREVESMLKDLLDE